MSKFLDLSRFNYKDEKEPEKGGLDTSILSEEQKLAFERFKNKENIFLTGPGGTGKTKLIQYFVEHSVNNGSKYQVCAMTGCAAILLNCNARTLHSWSGIKLAKGKKSKIIESVVNNRNSLRNWKKTSVLILDEVSMLSKKIFDLLEELARTVKKNSLPFGGMQLVFSGDFCQLPPIGTPGERDTFSFCFQSECWNNVFPKNNHILLTKIFRQTDVNYMNTLQNIRKGVITINDYTLLKECLNKKFDQEKHNGCVPTKLFPLRSKTDYVNKIMYSELEGEDHLFELTQVTNNLLYDNGKPIPTPVLNSCEKLTTNEIEHEISQLITNTPSVQMLRLKIGAAVMCNVNLDMDNSICNGSQGIVKDIIKNGDSPPVIVVKFSNGIIKHILPYFWQSEEYPIISIGQYPLCLAWALTIHKIQGATLDIAEIDVGNSVFEYGQTYVALSRVKSMDGLYLSAFEPERIQTNPIVSEFYENISKFNVLEKQEKSTDIKKIVL